MTPSLFDGTEAVDEYTFMLSPKAADRLEQHRQSFMTEADFRWLRDHGITAVRIPVGYWIINGYPPFTAGVSYLDWAMEMASKYKLKVLIDMHGLQGSQNGKDHSGRVGPARWYRKRSYRLSSLDSAEAIARRYCDHPQLWGFQIINEPRLGVFQFKLRRYYREAYLRLASILRSDTAIVYSDGFTPRLMSSALRHRSHPVIMDVHLYHMSTIGAVYRSLTWYWGKLRRRHAALVQLHRRHPIIIGEWSGVISGKTMRSVPTPEHEKVFRHYVAEQLKQYEDFTGWFYWSYKTEQPGQWHFRSMVEKGLIKMPGYQEE
jgi:glucan 1,3-beta-glucosidase